MCISSFCILYDHCFFAVYQPVYSEIADCECLPQNSKLKIFIYVKLTFHNFRLLALHLFTLVKYIMRINKLFHENSLSPP